MKEIGQKFFQRQFLQSTQRHKVLKANAAIASNPCSKLLLCAWLRMAACRWLTHEEPAPPESPSACAADCTLSGTGPWKYLSMTWRTLGSGRRTTGKALKARQSNHERQPAQRRYAGPAPRLHSYLPRNLNKTISAVARIRAVCTHPDWRSLPKAALTCLTVCFGSCFFTAWSFLFMSPVRLASFFFLVPCFFLARSILRCGGKNRLPRALFNVLWGFFGTFTFKVLPVRNKHFPKKRQSYASWPLSTKLVLRQGIWFCNALSSCKKRTKVQRWCLVWQTCLWQSFSAQSALQMATTSLRENGGFQRGSSSLNHIKLWKHIVGIFELAQQRDLDAFGKRIITC